MSRLLIAFLLCLSHPAWAQLARIELHPFVSASPTDQQFLTGQRDVNPVTLAGELRLPSAGNERLPAIILLHGSGGLGNASDLWAREILATNTAVFLVDSVTGRGLVNLAPDQDRLSRLAGVVDAYRALDLLAAHPRIDPARIAVLGFSRGGGGALWAAIERFREMHGRRDGPAFAGFVAFYPTCNRDFRDGSRVSARPILILHGTADDYVPIAECRVLVERLRAEGGDARLIEVPDAFHVFDEPRLPARQRIPPFQTTRNCPRMEETPEGILVNSVTRQPFTYRGDPCVERGVSVGHSPAGLAQAQVVLREFIATALAPR